MAKIAGRSLIGFHDGKGSGEPLYATDPTTGEHLQPGFIAATPEEVDEAVRLSSEGFLTYSRTSGRVRAAFLRTIATKIESIAGEIIERAGRETALPQARLQGETARTCGQLRLFAQVAEEGSWVEARIDHADPDRKPAPRQDIRSMLRPLGPVVVFGASNFPLAFSVAGGDTASALAGGNPVIVKAHAAHPGTSELVGQMVREAARECGMPEGVFSLLFGSGSQIGTALMKHPLVKAGGFTGSRAAGRILMDVAAARPEPIPFYAEMSSTNPVFILPGALRERGDAIASGLHTSFTLGAGQFCTKPGMVFLSQCNEAASFTDKLRTLVSASNPFHLLTKAIHSSYDAALAERKSDTAVTLVAEAPRPDEKGFAVSSALFETDAAAFLGSTWTLKSSAPRLFLCATRVATSFSKLPALLKDISPRRFTARRRISVTSPTSSRSSKPKSDASSSTAFRPESKSPTPWSTEAHIPQRQTDAPHRLERGRFSGLRGRSAIKDSPTKHCPKS